jgi:hypothetical protein
LRHDGLEGSPYVRTPLPVSDEGFHQGVDMRNLKLRLAVAGAVTLLGLAVLVLAAGGAWIQGLP